MKKKTGNSLVILVLLALLVVIGVALVAYVRTEKKAADLARETQSLRAQLEQLRDASQTVVREYTARIEELEARIQELTASTSPAGSTPTSSEAVEPADPSPPESTLSTLAEPEPASQPTPTPTVTPQPRPTVNANVANHAKVLVWKYHGEPRYDVLTITRTDNTVARIWDVSGRFAYVSGEVQTFDAIIEEQTNGDWWLLAFSWT